MPNWTLGPEYIRLFGTPGARNDRPARARAKRRVFRLPPGRFSGAHERCVNAACTTPERAHAGHGYCQGCYWRARREGAV